MSINWVVTPPVSLGIFLPVQTGENMWVKLVDGNPFGSHWASMHWHIFSSTVYKCIADCTFLYRGHKNMLCSIGFICHYMPFTVVYIWALFWGYTSLAYTFNRRLDCCVYRAFMTALVPFFFFFLFLFFFCTNFLFISGAQRWIYFVVLVFFFH